MKAFHGKMRVGALGASISLTFPQIILVFRKQTVLKNQSRNSFSIVLAANLPPAVGPLIVDPGYSTNHNQGFRRITNRSPSFVFSALSVTASLDVIAQSHRSPHGLPDHFVRAAGLTFIPERFIDIDLSVNGAKKNQLSSFASSGCVTASDRVIRRKNIGPGDCSQSLNLGSLLPPIADG